MKTSSLPLNRFKLSTAAKNKEKNTSGLSRSNLGSFSDDGDDGERAASEIGFQRFEKRNKEEFSMFSNGFGVDAVGFEDEGVDFVFRIAEEPFSPYS